MKFSPYQVICDFFIGKNIKFIIEERLYPDGQKIDVRESIRWYSYQEGMDIYKEWEAREHLHYVFRDSIREDKIIKIEHKGYFWIFHTLKGYEIKRKFNEQLFII